MNLANLFRPPPMDPMLKIVSEVAIFRDCNRAELEALKLHLHERHFLAGEIVFDEGEEGEGPAKERGPPGAPSPRESEGHRSGPRNPQKEGQAGRPKAKGRGSQRTTMQASSGQGRSEEAESAREPR